MGLQSKLTVYAAIGGVIVDCDIETGLASRIKSYIFGSQLNNS